MRTLKPALSEVLWELFPCCAEDEEDPYSGCTWRKELAGYGFGLPLTR